MILLKILRFLILLSISIALLLFNTETVERRFSANNHQD